VGRVWEGKLRVPLKPFRGGLDALARKRLAEFRVTNLNMFSNPAGAVTHLALGAGTLLRQLAVR
jgi:hypothetical protein